MQFSVNGMVKRRLHFRFICTMSAVLAHVSLASGCCLTSKLLSLSIAHLSFSLQPISGVIKTMCVSFYQSVALSSI